MNLTRLSITGVTVTAGLVAVLAVVYSLLVVKMSPTPAELAERFSVFADDATDPSVVVAKRILALDGNGDTYVGRNELPERMQSLMRGDQNGDGLLAANEVKAVVTRAGASRPLFPPPPLRRGRSTNLVDVVRDQKLPQAKHDFAMALVKNAVAAASSDVYVRLHEVLDGEEYENLQAAATRAGLGPRTSLGMGATGDQSVNTVSLRN
jgi:hypothetical protein